MILNRTFGPYVLVQRLAVGGMAELYLALKHGPGNFQKFVVVKVILPHCNDDPEFVRLFYREAELAGLLHHPNVVHTYDCDVYQGTHYMVMEYMRGVTVAEMAERGAEVGLPLPQELAVGLFIDVCEGFGYVHRLQNEEGRFMEIVHRDISPQNIFATFDGLGKVFDFGIARFNSSDGIDPHHGTLAGKVAYMSPEQCRGEALDARSDIYSLGIILFELTTGRRLFKRENHVQTIRAISDGEVPSPRTLLDRYPRYLEKVVMRALAHNKNDRYPNALEFGDELRKFLKISGAKPTPHMLGDYLARLFTAEIRDQERFRADAVLQVEAAHPRRDPLAGLTVKAAAPENEMVSIGADVVLTPDEGPEILAPHQRVSVPREVHQPERSTGPQRLAQVEIAPTMPEAQGVDYEALKRVRRSNRVMIFVTLIALIIGIGTVAYMVLQETAPPSQPKEEVAPQEDTTSGTIRITSRPFGAEILLNGSPREERTPTEIAVPFGQPVEIEVRAEGFTPYTKTVTLAQGQQRYVVDAQLKKAVAEAPAIEKTTVRLSSVPDGAQVAFDGQPLEGMTPIVLEDVVVGAQHVVVLNMDGHETLVFPFLPSDTAQLEFAVQLEEHPSHKLGILMVDSWPRGATVTIDETFAGLTPLPPLHLAAREEHVVTVAMGGVEPHVETVKLKRGETIAISPRLGASKGEDPGTAENQDDVAMIDITSEPLIEVYIDKSVGKTPLESVMVAPGTHWVEFRDDAKGIRHVEVVSFKPFEVTSLNITIPKGALSVTAEPEAEVFVDGESVGTTPVELQAYVGTHTVRLEAGEQKKEIEAAVSTDLPFSHHETFQE